MRNIGLLLGCAVLATTASGLRRTKPTLFLGPIGPPSTRSAFELPSYVRKELLAGPLVPVLPTFLVVSPVPAKLAEGAPPT